MNGEKSRATDRDVHEDSDALAGAQGAAERPRVPRLPSVIAVVVAVATHLFAQAGMMLTVSGWRPSTFRNYYYSDQLSYLAIAANAKRGTLAAVEPFTETGSSYYPHLYYLAVGTLARWTSTSPAAMWTMLGLASQALVVAVIASACILLTRRWWTGLLGFIPFVLGTYSWLVAHEWLTRPDSHSVAVLWGPFGVMYPLNGETAALCIGGAALLALVLAVAGRIPRKFVWASAVVSCLAIGALANVQTYSFLVTVYLLAGGTAAVGLVRARSRIALAMTVLAFPVLFAAGPVIASRTSPLVTLVFGMLPAVPGLVLCARRLGWRFAWCLAALVLGAAPQVVATALGVVNHDAFLVYRQSSSHLLGVPWPSGLIAAAGVIPALVLVALAGVWSRRSEWLAFAAAAAVVWTLVALNDRWGANQEPYRFWLDAYVLIAIVVVPLVAWAATDMATSVRGRAWSRSRGKEAGAVHRAPTASRARHRTLVALLTLTIAASVGSSVDFFKFREVVTKQAYLQLYTARNFAAAELGDRTGHGIVLLDACLDPLQIKAVWGGPVVYYNRGLAWPADVQDIQAAMSWRGTSGALDVARARAAGIDWLMSDRACPVDLAVGLGDHLAATVTYPAENGAPSGTLELWSLARV